MRKLTEEELEEMKGSFNGLACAGDALGIAASMIGIAAGITNPIGWVVFGLGALGTGFGIASDINACDYD